MRKRGERQKRRFGNAGVQLAALGVAVSVFGVSAVLGADMLADTAVYAAADPYEGITQEGELGIAQVLAEESGFDLDEGIAVSEESAENADSSAEESSPLSSQEEQADVLSSRQPAEVPESSVPPSQPASSGQASEKPPASSSNGNMEDEDLIAVIAGAVQCEIVGTNTTPIPQYYEAYKAQAVACRSYMEHYKKAYGRYPAMSYRTPHSKTVELVRQVYREVLYYGNSPANAVYHAASGGHTQSSQYVWGGALPYLSAVESAYDDLPSSYAISVDAARQKLSAAGIAVSGEPDTWFDLSGATYTDGGFVSTIPVCGTAVSANTLRDRVFGASNLKSTKITDITVSGGLITFSTKGYGHGVGLSQRGALGYSAAGWGYHQILTHYYKGVTIRTM